MDIIDLFFNPKSIVLFGASERPGSVGQSTLANLLTSKDKLDLSLRNDNY